MGGCIINTCTLCIIIKKLKKVKMNVSVKLMAIILLGGIATNGFAQTKKQPVKSVVSILEKTPETSVFLGHLKKNNLTGVLNTETVFTIFAPVNSVFEKGTQQPDSGININQVASLPANWCEGFITEGIFDLNAIIEQIRANNWKTQITTKNGAVLWATLDKGAVKLSDEKGNAARIVKYNLPAANGIVHIIEGNLPVQ
jgi:uncharacterized surface protein with fasciclin (FAS1) repeats